MCCGSFIYKGNCMHHIDLFREGKHTFESQYNRWPLILLIMSIFNTYLCLTVITMEAKMSIFITLSKFSIFLMPLEIIFKQCFIFHSRRTLSIKRLFIRLVVFAERLRSEAILLSIKTDNIAWLLRVWRVTWLNSCYTQQVQAAEQGLGGEKTT